jgi:hypothetical protein
VLLKIRIVHSTIQVFALLDRHHLHVNLPL